MSEPSAGIKDYYMFLLSQAHILNKFVDKFNKFDLFLTKNGFKQANQQLQINNLDSIKGIVKKLDIENLKEQQEDNTEETTEEPSPSNKLVDEFVKSRFYTDLEQLSITLNSFVDNFIGMWEAGLTPETQPAAIEYITKYTATDKTPDTLEAEIPIGIDIREFNQQMKILRQYYDFFMENAKPILKSLKADPELSPNVTPAQPADQEQDGEQQDGEQQDGQEQESTSSDLSDPQAVIAALEGIGETALYGLEKIYDIYSAAAKINAAERSVTDGWVTTQLEKIQLYYNTEGKKTTSTGETILLEVSRLGLGDEFRLAIMRALNKTLGLNPDAEPWLSAAVKEFRKTDFYKKIKDPKVKRGLIFIVNQLFNNQTISEDLVFAKLQIASHTDFGGEKFVEALTKLIRQNRDIAKETLKFFYMKRNGTEFAHVVKNLQTTAKERQKKKKAKENLLEKLIKEQLKVLNGKKMVCN